MASSSNLVTAAQANLKFLNYQQGMTNTEWTKIEDSILEEGLARYASLSKLKQYAKIQKLLQNKTIRDVAFRCQWINSMKKSTYPSTPGSVVNNAEDDMLCNKIGGLAGKLLEENMQAFKQISNNFETNQIHDNIKYFSRVRDNILILSNKLSVMPEGITNMPPLSEKMNEELANIILPHTISWIQL